MKGFIAVIAQDYVHDKRRCGNLPSRSWLAWDAGRTLTGGGWVVRRGASLCQPVPACASLCQPVPAVPAVPACASRCQPVPACASLCQPVRGASRASPLPASRLAADQLSPGPTVRQQGPTDVRQMSDSPTVSDSPTLRQLRQLSDSDHVFMLSDPPPTAPTAPTGLRQLRQQSDSSDSSPPGMAPFGWNALG